MSELANARHEAFAQGLAEGKKQKEAYTAAFPRAQHWKDQTIYNKASALANQEDVIERVQELQQQATSAAVLTITQRKELLSQIALNIEENTANRIKAIDTLNKMDGAYIEQVNVNGTIPVVIAGADALED